IFWLIKALLISSLGSVGSLRLAATLLRALRVRVRGHRDSFTVVHRFGNVFRDDERLVIVLLGRAGGRHTVVVVAGNRRREILVELLVLGLGLANLDFEIDEGICEIVDGTGLNRIGLLEKLLCLEAQRCGLVARLSLVLLRIADAVKDGEKGRGHSVGGKRWRMKGGERE
ncbi:hypothetical protein PFISCL1PPCAC_11839, partial [Pristionchus fissidentatus]